MQFMHPANILRHLVKFVDKSYSVKTVHVSIQGKIIVNCWNDKKSISWLVYLQQVSDLQPLHWVQNTVEQRIGWIIWFKAKRKVQKLAPIKEDAENCPVLSISIKEALIVISWFYQQSCWPQVCQFHLKVHLFACMTRKQCLLYQCAFELSAQLSLDVFRNVDEMLLLKVHSKLRHGSDCWDPLTVSHH